MTDYELQISYPARTDPDERLDAIFFAHGSSGSFVEESGEQTILHAFFESAAARNAASEALRRDAQSASWTPLTLLEIDREREDWLGRYQQSLRAFAVGRRFVVAPDRELIADHERIALVIPQERAFGTGSHETTALCLEMLEELPLSGRDCLDIGTGSGILAIAMSVLGGRRVIAFDNDLDSLGVVERNLRRNGIGRTRLQHFIGSLESVPNARFDLVTMNIIPEVIIPMLAVVRSVLREGGCLVVSGVLSAEWTKVDAAATRAGLRLRRQRTAGEWWCGDFGVR